MIEIYVIVGIVLVAAGIASGVIAVVCLGIRREEKAFSLTSDSPNRMTSGARVACGVYTRGFEAVPRARRQWWD